LRGSRSAETRRPAYHRSVLLTIFLHPNRCHLHRQLRLSRHRRSPRRRARRLPSGWRGLRLTSAAGRSPRPRSLRRRCSARHRRHSGAGPVVLLRTIVGLTRHAAADRILGQRPAARGDSAKRDFGFALRRAGSRTAALLGSRDHVAQPCGCRCEIISPAGGSCPVDVTLITLTMVGVLPLNAAMKMPGRISGEHARKRGPFLALALVL